MGHLTMAAGAACVKRTSMGFHRGPRWARNMRNITPTASSMPWRERAATGSSSSSRTITRRPASSTDSAIESFSRCMYRIIAASAWRSVCSCVSSRLIAPKSDMRQDSAICSPTVSHPDLRADASSRRTTDATGMRKSGFERNAGFSPSSRIISRGSSPRRRATGA